MTLTFSRRQAACILAASGALPVISAPLGPVFAQERSLDVRSGGAFKPVPIAVTGFAGDSGGEVASIVINNFNHSVFITPIGPERFGQQAVNPDQAPVMDAFRAANAQYVLTGRANREGGRVKTAFRLWDVSTGAQVTGQQYTTDANNLRRVAHLVSDAVFTRVTGEKGMFDSRVVFIDESGPAEHRRKRLTIMDQDGASVRYITTGDNLVVTPRFSPSSQDITYMSFANSNPRVLFLNIETGQKQTVGNFPGMTFSPRFAPSGDKIIMSLTQGDATNLYTMDLHSKATQQLTDTQAINTSPSYSPDGARITFESDRGGTQQIYVMSADGGGAQRISFGDGRYSTPVWSPKGDYIAFTRQSKAGFGIGVMKPDGSGERILTEGFHNEGPTWAPNGLFVMFFRDPGGSGGSHIFMTDVFGRQEFPVPTPSFASDPAWGPLLG
jgi:TolB protein